ncbi:MAG: LacI family DNA-binding transcriptional regulator [Lachnospiraceae bacterium]|nr:LacI family DNA-binding transcriptional regulator [Lachnospiraceae bacterium]
MRKVRLADIAQAVGVSAVTVHNALNGQKGVSDQLREEIQRVADQMGYETLVKDKSTKEEGSDFQKIGVLIAEKYLGNHATYYWKIYQELALAATEKQCYTIVETLRTDGNTAFFEIPQMILQNSVQGIIIIGEIEKDQIRQMKEAASQPIVLLDFYDREFAQDAVIADNFYGMYQMTEILFDRGLEEIGFVGSIHATNSIMDRYCGYMKSMMEHGKNIHPEWVIEDRDETGVVEFELPKRLPKAFVCNCDLTAGMLVNKLGARGLKVPDDISVVGFDNFLYPGYADHGITTYEVNIKAMVKVAIKKLVKQFRSSGQGSSLEIISGHVVMKNSVKR